MGYIRTHGVDFSYRYTQDHYLSVDALIIPMHHLGLQQRMTWVTSLEFNRSELGQPVE